MFLIVCLVVADAERKEIFESKLLTMPTSEAIYLLTTFSKMAASVSSEQRQFVHVISKEIYEVSFKVSIVKSPFDITDKLM